MSGASPAGAERTRVLPRAELLADLRALRGQRRRSGPEKDRPVAAHHAEHRADVVREIGQLVLKDLGVHRQFIAAAGCRVGAEEFEAERVAQHRLAMGVLLGRPFHDLDRPAFRLDPELARAAAAVDEALQFPVAPAGVQIAGRDDRDQDRRAAQLFFEIGAEVVGGAEARIAPQDRLLSELLVEFDLQALVKRRDPAFLANGLIVEVAVADEHVIAEAGDVGHDMDLGLAVCQRGSLPLYHEGRGGHSL